MTADTTKPLWGSPQEVLIFPKWGEQKYGTIPFQVLEPKDGKKNAIVLRAGWRPDNAYPNSVSVPCNAACKSIHLLSGVAGSGYPQIKEKSVTMVVRLHYADGSREDHELLNGVHFSNLDANSNVPDSKQAFKLPLPVPGGGGWTHGQVRYLALTPKKSDMKIETIEFAKGNRGDIASPVVMAVTVEKGGQEPKRVAVRSRTVGGQDGGQPFESTGEQGSFLVGFGYKTRFEELKRPEIAYLQPIYWHPAGRKVADGFGNQSDSKAHPNIEAKDGYAIGGLLLWSSDIAGFHLVRGMKIKFMRLRNEALDPADSYWSGWIGLTGEGQKTTMLGGDGQPIVGLHGRAGGAINCLGIIQLSAAEAKPEPKNDDKRTVDLLKLIDPKRDAVVGRWSFNDKALVVSPPDGYARLQIPYIPPAEYTLTVITERKEGGDVFAIGLISSGRQFAAEIDGYPQDGFRSGLSLLDGKPIPNNETTRKGQVIKNRNPTKIVYSVRKTGVTVTVDGKPLLSYKGDAKRLYRQNDWAVPDKRALFIGSVGNTWHITKLELTPIKGEGKEVDESTKWIDVFRSDDPTNWNKNVNKGKDYAIEVKTVPDRIKYLKLARSTGDYVILEMTKDKLTERADDGRYGWNGTVSFEYRGYHLGIYDANTSSKKGQVDIYVAGMNLGRGGWGFGNRSEVDDQQGYGWGGKEIPKTVFIISVKTGSLTAEESEKLLAGK